MSSATIDLGAVSDPAQIRWPFARPFENFRLLDPLSRVVAIAVESLELRFPANTAVVLATNEGCLWTDRAFERSRHTELRPGLFPYTLPSAAIAAVAIRHGLRGPALCLSGDAGAREEAERLLQTGEADAVLLCVGDVVPPERARITAHYLTR